VARLKNRRRTHDQPYGIWNWNGRFRKIPVSARVEIAFNNETKACQFHKKGYFQHGMKATERLKQIEFDQQIQGLLRALLGRVPFLKVKSFQPMSEVLGSQPDWLVEVEAGERPWVLVVEGKQHGQLREVRNGLLQMQRFQDQTWGKPCY
jgi:hypothetical protein